MEFVKDTCKVIKKEQSALHVKMVGWLHDGQNSMPFPG